MQSGFQLIAPAGRRIRFRYYHDEAPQTCAAFHQCLPIELELYHAKTSGEEVWTPEAPRLELPHENASIFIQPGEVVLGPLHQRNRISGCLGIMYGAGHLLDAGNIFAMADTEDLDLLRAFGESLWHEGKKRIRLESRP